MDKGQQIYYSQQRQEIGPLLAPTYQRVLEIGCGEGATLAWVRDERSVEFAAGYELMPDAAARAATRLDHVIQGDAETLELDPALGQFDLILCLDVLEHMRDPWAFLERIQQRLVPGGQVIASIPNIRHHTIITRLALRGRWDYTPSGLLDRTHLRFFTRHSALQLMRVGHLQVDACLPNVVSSRARWFNRLTMGRCEELLTFQYLISARLPAYGSET